MVIMVKCCFMMELYHIIINVISLHEKCTGSVREIINYFWTYANTIGALVINVQWVTFHNMFIMLWIVFESHYIKPITKIKYLHEGTIKHEPKITSKRVQTLKEKLLINLKQKNIISPLTSSSNEYFTFFSSCN